MHDILAGTATARIVGFGGASILLVRNNRSPSEHKPGSQAVMFSFHRASLGRVAGQHCTLLPRGQDCRTGHSIRARILLTWGVPQKDRRDRVLNVLKPSR